MTAAYTLNALTGDKVETALLMLAEKMRERPRETAAVSFPFFCMHYLAPHFDAGFGQFQLPLMEELSELRPGQHVLYLFPREHGKTTVYNFALTLWWICYRRKLHIGIISSTMDTSEKFLANIKSELENNQRIVDDFGDLSGERNEKTTKKRRWKTRYIKTTNFVIVFAGSTNGNVRGVNEALPGDLVKDFAGYDRSGAPLYNNMKLRRPDAFICDDIVDDKFIITKRVRDKTWWWFWKALYNATEASKSNILVVGTTLHEDDVVSRLWNDKVQTSQWKKQRLSAVNPDHPFDINGEPVDLLFPEKWGKIDYNRPLKVYDEDTGGERIEYRTLIWWKHHDLGAAFGPEFLMRPMLASAKFFSKKWFNWYAIKTKRITPQLQQKVLMNTGKMLEYLPSDLICVTTVDPAGTEQERADADATDPDYTVVCTMGYSPSTRRFYVVGLNRMRCSPGQMLQSMLIHYQMYNKNYGGKYVPDVSSPRDYYLGFPFQHIGIGIETVAFQRVLATMLEEIAPQLGIYPTVIELDRKDKRSKRLRAMGPSALCQQGLLVFPSPLIPGACGEDMLAAIDELDAYPQGAHDDTVDAVVDGMEILNGLALTINRGMVGEAAVQELMSGAFGFRAHDLGSQLAFASNDVASIGPARIAKPASHPQDRGKWLGS